jgi:hypothetical protein
MQYCMPAYGRKIAGNSAGLDMRTAGYEVRYFYALCIEWALVGPSFTRENKLLIFLVYRGRACCSRL